MNKTKCTKIVSLGLTVLLLCGLLCVPAAAETENLFPNPEFTVENNRVTGWSYYADASVGQIVSKPEDAPANVQGSAFHSVTKSHGLQTSDFLSLNAGRSCYVTFWYKTNVDKSMQIVFMEYSADSTERLGAPTFDLPSTNGTWKLYRKFFQATEKDTTRVKVIIRLAGDNLATAKAYFMYPTFTHKTPMLTDGYFDDYLGSNGWTISSTSINTNSKIEIASETSNRYLLLDSSSEETNDLHVINYTPREFTVNSSASPQKYKISFKYKPISAIEGKSFAPRIEVNIGYIRTKDADGSLNYVQGSGAYKISNLVTLNSTHALGTPSFDGWTQYVSYVEVPAKNTIVTEGTVESSYTATGNNCINFIRAWNAKGNAGTAIAYDDFSIEPVETEYIIYQNGVETETLENGKNVGIKFHNADAVDAACAFVLYQIEGNVKLIKDIVLISSVANTAIADEPEHTFEIPLTGEYQVSAFAWDGFDSMHPSLPVASAKTVTTK